VSLSIAIDLDGVTADFSNGWADLYEQWFDRIVPNKDRRSWTSCFEHTHFTTPDDFWAWTDEADLWRQLDVIRGAQGGIYRLRQEGHRVFFLTNRHDNARAATIDWLRQHFGPRHPELSMTKTKAAVPAALYVDDSPRVLQELVDAGVNNIVRFVQPWNEPIPGVHDAGSWDQVLDLVRYIDRHESAVG
jgi:5'(3')-deoxyribonucleotidase